MLEEKPSAVSGGGTARKKSKQQVILELVCNTRFYCQANVFGLPFDNDFYKRKTLLLHSEDLHQ